MGKQFNKSSGHIVILVYMQWLVCVYHPHTLSDNSHSHSHVHCRKQWLREVGSPESHIDRCEFSRERTIPRTLYDRFTIRRNNIIPSGSELHV